MNWRQLCRICAMVLLLVGRMRLGGMWKGSARLRCCVRNLESHWLVAVVDCGWQRMGMRKEDG